MNNLTQRTLKQLVLLASAIGLAASMQAAQRTWTGGGPDGNWNTILNWDTGVPVSGDSVVFNGATRRLNTNNILGLSLSGLSYNSNAFQTAGSAVTLTGGAFASVGSNTNNLAITLSGAQAFTNDMAGTLLVFGGNITNAGNRLSVGGSGSVWLNGVMTSSGGLTVLGPGTNRLNGANVFTNGPVGNGSIDVQGGVLQIGNAAAIPSGNGRGDLTNSALVDLNGNSQSVNGIYGAGTFDNLTGSATYTLSIGNNATNSGGNFSGTIQNTSGRIGLNKVTTNVLTLTGGANHFGPTTVSAGTLVLGPSTTLGSSTNITIVSGAVLDASQISGGLPLGTTQTLIAGRTTNGGPADLYGSVSSSGVIAPYKYGFAGTMTISNGLTLSGGFLDFDLGNSTIAGSGSNDMIVINGPLALSGTTTLRMNPFIGSLGIGNYTLISNLSGTVTGDTNNLAVVSPRGVTAAFDTTTAPGSLLMSVSGSVTPASLVWSGASSPTWDVQTSQSWLNGVSPDYFYFLDNVLFDDRGLPNVSLEIGVSPSGTTFNNVSTNYSIGTSGLNNGSIGGAGSLTLNGPGMVTLNTANSFTGNTVVNRGTLVLGGYNTGTFVLNTVAYNGVTPADLIVGAGGVFLQGVANSAHGNTFTNLRIKPGGSSLSMRARQSNETTYYYQFTGWQRDVGGTIDFNNIQTRPSSYCGLFFTNTATANSILGGWATIYEENWVVPVNGVGATSLGSSNFLAYQTTTTPTAWVATSNISLTASPSASLNDTEINSLKLNNSTVTINAGQTLKLTTGGLLMGTAATGAAVINGGTIKGATNADLIVHNHSLSQTLTIGSVIADNVGATALTKAGQGKLILTGANTYSGPTYIGGAVISGGAGSTPGILGIGTLQIGNGGTTGDLGASPAITNYGILAVNRSDSFTLGVPLAGPGAFQQLGSGTTFLTGTNSYSGTTTISGGTLQVGNGSTAGDLGNSSNIVNNATLVFARSDNVSVNGPISGLGLLTQQGTGMLTLNTNETFSGGIRINAGGIVFGQNASASNAASFTMAINTTLTTPPSGLTLNPAVSQFISGRGVITGAVTCVTGTRLSPGTNGTAQTMTIAGDLTMGGGTINFDINSAGSKDLLVVSSNLTLNSGVVALSITGTLTNGTYKLIQYGGSLLATNLSFNGFSQPGQLAAISYATPGEVNLVVSTYVSQNLVWQGDGAGNLWNTSANNWTNQSGLTTNFFDFDNVTFDDSSANLNVTIVGSRTPSVVNVSAAVNSYTLQGAGEIASGFVNKTGAATLTVLTTNTSGSPVNIAAGTVQLGDGSTANGSLGTGNITNNATLIFNEPSAISVGSAMFGSGVVVKQGPDMVSLTGNNGSFAGGVDLQSGSISVGIGAGVGTLGTGAVTNSSLLIFNRSGSLSYSGGVYGNGVVSNVGPGVVTLGGTNSFGNLYVGNGTLKAGANEIVPDALNNGSTGWLILDGAPTTAGTFDLNGFNETVNGLSGLNGTVLGKVVNDGGTTTNRLTFITAATTTNSFSGRILDNNGAGGKVSLLMSGPGQQQLNIINSGGNTYSGGTVISNGILAVTTPYLGSGVLQQPNANTLAFGGGPITICGGALALNWDNNATPTYGSVGNAVIIPANCVGTIMPSPRGGFNPTVTGSGTMVYAANFVRSDFGANMTGFTGSVVISNNPAGNNAGNEFRVTATTGIPNSPVTLLSNVVMAGMSAPAGGIPIGELSGTNCFIGSSSGSAGTTWRVGGLNTSTNFGGNIGNANGILKDGTGSWTLAGVNTYSGTTAVTNGVLILDADSAFSANSTPFDLRSTNAALDVTRLTGGTLNLGAGQTLQGNGTVRGSVAAGGTVNPGAGIGRINITNVMTFTSTVTVNMEIDRTNSPTTADLISAPTIIADGTLNVNNLGLVLQTGDTFKLFSQGISNAFATVNLPVSGFDPSNNLVTYTWTNKLAIDGTVQVLSGYVPPVLVNTNATNMIFSYTGGNLTVTWPADHVGWRLQTQTNSRAVGLVPATNAWFDVAGATITNQMDFPVSPGNPTVFFRMVYP